MSVIVRRMSVFKGANHFSLSHFRVYLFIRFSTRVSRFEYQYFTRSTCKSSHSCGVRCTMVLCSTLE